MNVEVVMINGLSPWGNKHLIPHNSLREPLESLYRAHIGVIHHADLFNSSSILIWFSVAILMMFEVLILYLLS
ncbi:hypothetical protein KSP39_PZI023533 [Platanthera zijinensis]|uniref:tetraacyldisaccharide 4'-kinase n=1 Tax=Platanthera zijinensis TaxID=2320716 RepID=A0AAP0FUA2_9ASPA